MHNAVLPSVTVKLEKSNNISPNGVRCSSQAAPVVGYTGRASPYTHLDSASSITFLWWSKMNPALNHPAPFPIRDHVSQALQCLYVNHRKLASVRRHLDYNKAMYVWGEARADCTEHANSRDPKHSMLTGLVPDSGEWHKLASSRSLSASYISHKQAWSKAQWVRLAGCLKCKALVHRSPWMS